MAFGIRKINRNGMHHGFQWPLEVGAVVTAPDWNPEAVCGGGLHFCKPIEDSFVYLIGDLFAVIEYDEDKAVDLDGKHKVETCKIVYLSESTNGILEFFKDVQFDSKNAYNWALDIGDHEYMRPFVTAPQNAYYWASYIGDRDHMRQFVNTPEYAYMWARYLGDREHMKQFVTDPQYAYYWVRHFNDDLDYMKQFITDSEYAYRWVRFIDKNDREHMKQFVTDPRNAYYWALHIGDREHMRQFCH